MAVAKNTVTVGYLDPGEWAAVFGMSYRDLLMHDFTHEGRIVRKGGQELRMLCGSGGIPAGRNKIAQGFLDTDSEWLWVVDSDMGFQPDTVDRLLASAHKRYKPVMGGLCFQQKRIGYSDLKAMRYEIRPTLYDWAEIKETGEQGFHTIDDYKRDTVVRVDGTGSACVLIHRTVLEKIKDKYGPDSWYDPIKVPGAGGNGTARTFSEDLSFCIRAASVGVPIHVDTSVKTTHYKGGLYLDEELFDAQRGG